jgi:uncharacterized lipoprotein YddW (UPF0748 family)
MKKLLSLALTCLVFVSQLETSTASEKEGPRARFATVFTFLDAVFDTDKVWTREDVIAEMANAKSLGVERMYWRVDGGGYFVYPTRVGTQYQWDGRGPKSAALKESIDKLGDPLRVFAEEAKKQGIEFYAWYPIRDRNSTSDRWNPKNPEEKEIYEKAGRHVAISEFYKNNPQFNMERRHGDGSAISTPRIRAIRLHTADAGASIGVENLQIWQSDDNLEYQPVADDWTVKREPGPTGGSIFTLENLDATKPWIKVSKRGQDDWSFNGGGLDDWITVVDENGKEWAPHVWVAIMDKNPRFGEARFPYKSASRAKDIKNDVPWDTITKIGFDKHRHSLALFTPAMQPEQYLFGYPCFAYPEVRAYEMRVIEELLTYPIDGIALCLRTHVRSTIGEEYGFNPPVLAEYRKRHGDDVALEDIESSKVREILGDAYSQLVKEISEAVHGGGRKLVAMFEPDPSLGLEYQPGQMSPWWDLGRMDWQWKKWVDKGWVDGVIVFTTGFNLPWDESLQTYLAGVKHEAGDAEVSLFYDPYFDPERQSVNAFLRLVRGALASPSVDELNVFEYVEFNKPEQQLNRAVKSLALGQPASTKKPEPKTE